MDKLIIKKNGEILKELDLEQEVLTIGRGDENDLVLEDEEKIISRKHARLEKREDGYYIVNTSANGTMINGEKINEHKLDKAAEIKIGRYILEFKPGKKGYREEMGTLIEEKESGTVIMGGEEPADEGTLIKIREEKKPKSAEKIKQGVMEIPGTGIKAKKIGFIVAPVLVVVLYFLFFRINYEMRFDVTPSDAQVYVNDIKMPASGGGILKKISAGKFAVKITHPRYEEMRVVEIKLNRGRNKVKIISDLKGIRAEK